jgi:hypothetical protein
MFLSVGEVALEVVLKIMHVDVSTCEAPARSNMEVSDHLVHTEDTFKSATLSTLRFKTLRIALTFALFNIFTLSESPLLLCIGLSDFLTSVTAPLFTGRYRDSAALAAVIGVEMFRCFLLRVTAHNIYERGE